MAKTPEQLARIRENARAWYARNANKRKLAQKLMRQRDPEKVNMRRAELRSQRSSAQVTHDNDVVKLWRSDPKNWARGRAKILKARAIKTGVPYNDDMIADLQSQLPASTCDCCRKDLQWGPREGNKYNPNGPSVDKIIPSVGYVAGNVRVICMRCNLVKRDSSLAELEASVLYIRKHTTKTIAAWGCE